MIPWVTGFRAGDHITSVPTPNPYLVSPTSGGVRAASALNLALEGDTAVRQWEERFSSEGGETQGEGVSFISCPTVMMTGLDDRS